MLCKIKTDNEGLYFTGIDFLMKNTIPSYLIYIYKIHIFTLDQKITGLI